MVLEQKQRGVQSIEQKGRRPWKIQLRQCLKCSNALGGLEKSTSLTFPYVVYCLTSLRIPKST